MITVALEQDELVVEPGGTAKIQVTVTNNGEAAGRFGLEIEGLDPEWCAIPVSSFTLEPGQQASERILVKPPRSSESRAGVYPFVVSVCSLESGERVSRQGSVNIRAFNLLTIELMPKRGVVSPLGRTCYFQVGVGNLGNTEQHLQLFASDPEDGCTYQFDEERITLPPGGRQEVDLAVQATSSPFISTARLYGFTVSARSVENSHVSASTQGQVERRGVISPSVLVTVLVLLAISTVVWLLWPRAAVVAHFAVDRNAVMKGESVTVSWRTLHSNSVRLEFNGRVIGSNLETQGSMKFTPEESGRLVLVAQGNMGETPSREELITIQLPEALPPPEILELSVNPKTIRKGEPVTITYKVRNTDRIFITPPNIQLQPYLGSAEVRFERSGQYEFVAVNAENKTVSRKFSVTVVEADVDISFSVQPAVVKHPGDTVRLRWELRGAVEASIDNDIGPIDVSSGTLDVPVQKTTVFTLTAKDSAGKSASQTVKVTVESPAPETPQ
ncbi:MAG: hypothetical protein HRF45_01760 [Fimbriimonadia bacterium]|jgi:hypothetical protein